MNEPLTTARFSGLYGLWYPHRRDEATFARALLTETRATVLAMRAIRAVNPHAQLVQTEDLGRTYATPALAGLAAFYNQRRWLSLDLSAGAWYRATADTSGCFNAVSDAKSCYGWPRIPAHQISSV